MTKTSKTMETQFVPYELAVKLKELGFDLDVNAGFCGFYRSPRNRVVYGLELGSTIGEHTGNVIVCGAPLWQQAFDWFRDNHNLESTIGQLTSIIEKTFGYAIIATSPRNDSNNYVNGKRFSDYEAARTACLEKLIELITK